MTILGRVLGQMSHDGLLSTVRLRFPGEEPVEIDLRAPINDDITQVQPSNEEVDQNSLSPVARASSQELCAPVRGAAANAVSKTIPDVDTSSQESGPSEPQNHGETQTLSIPTSGSLELDSNGRTQNPSTTYPTVVYRQAGTTLQAGVPPLDRYLQMDRTRPTTMVLIPSRFTVNMDWGPGDYDLFDEICNWEGPPGPDSIWTVDLSGSVTLTNSMDGDVYLLIYLTTGTASACDWARGTIPVSGYTSDRQPLRICNPQHSALLFAGTISGSNSLNIGMETSSSGSARRTMLIAAGSKLRMFVRTVSVYTSAGAVGSSVVTIPSIRLTNVANQAPDVIMSAASMYVPDASVSVEGLVEVNVNGPVEVKASLYADPPLPILTTGSTTTDVRLVDSVVPHPIWTSDLSAQPPATTWAISSEDRNRAMHALNGNIDSDLPSDYNPDHRVDRSWVGGAADVVFDQEVHKHLDVVLDSSNFRNSIKSDLYYAICNFVFQFGDDNPFDNLANSEEEVYQDLDFEDEPPDLLDISPEEPANQPPKPKPERKTPPVVAKEEKEEEAPRTVLDPVARRKQREAALERIAYKLKGQGLFLHWLLTAPVDVNWAAAVAEVRWGDWRSATDPEAKLVRLWYEMKTRRSRGLTMRLEFAHYADECLPGWSICCESNTPLKTELDAKCPTWWSDIRVLKVEADAHNAYMHALNGNPVFVNTMGDVLSLPETTSYFEDHKTDNRFDGLAAASLLQTSMPGSNQYNDGLSMSNYLRMRRQLGDGSISQDWYMAPLEATMIPRQIWIGAGVGAAPFRPSWVVYADRPVQGQVLTASNFWAKQGQKDLMDGNQLGRDNIVNTNGYKLVDVNILGMRESANGLDMSMFVLKARLWQQLLCWMTNRYQELPVTNDLTADPAMVTQPGVPQGPYSLVNHPVPGESWGMSLAPPTPWFPMNGVVGGIGLRGTIAFHICLDSVPVEHRANVVVFPSALTGMFTTRGKALAIFCALMAPWPFFNVAIRRTVDNNLGAGAVQIACTAFANTVYLSGLTDIHVLIPRGAGGVGPNAQAEANVKAQERPHMGSFLTDIPVMANAPMDVSFVAAGGVGVQNYHLCAYLASWVPDITLLDIAYFLRGVNQMFDISTWLNMADERVAMSAVRYHAMTSNAAPVVSEATFREIAPDGRCVTTLGMAYPLPHPPAPMFSIPSFDIVAWNHMALGTRVCSTCPPSMASMSPRVTKISQVYWATLHARQFAMVWHIYQHFLRIPARVWDEPNFNWPNQEMPAIVNSQYSNRVVNNRFVHSDAGPAMHNIYKNCHNQSLFSDQFGNTVYDYLEPPQAGYVSAHDGQNPPNYEDEVCPVFFNDLYMCALLNKVPRALSLLPPVGGREGTSGIVIGDMTMLRTGAHFAPACNPSNQIDRLEETDSPDWDQNELWNVKVLMRWAAAQAPAVQVFTMDRNGNPIALQPMPWYVAMPLQHDVNIPVGQEIARTNCGMSSLWWPLVDGTGLRLFYALAQAPMNQFAPVMLARIRGDLETVLLPGTNVPGTLLWSNKPGPGISKQRALIMRVFSQASADPPGDMSLASAVLEGAVTAIVEPGVVAAAEAVRTLANVLDPPSTTTQGGAFATNL